MKYAIIAVEGQHDQAFVGKTLKLVGFDSFDGNLSNLDDFWRDFIPKYPRQGNLYKRLDMPSILSKETLSVAIYGGEGSNLARNLKAAFVNQPKYQANIVAFGIVSDADKKAPHQIVLEYCQAFKDSFPNFPNQPGVVNFNNPRTGIYVLPDNKSEGVLDMLLCQCAEIVYPDYTKRANEYLNQFSEEEKKALKWRPYDQEKALIATIVSVLKPGKTNTVSIADNHWISATPQQQVELLKNFVTFLQELLALTED